LRATPDRDVWGLRATPDRNVWGLRATPDRNVWGLRATPDRNVWGLRATPDRDVWGLLTLVGSIDPHHGTPIDPDNYNETVDYAFIEDAAQRIRARYPAMEHALSKGGWSGIYGVTPDWHPIIDEVPAGSGFFVAAGFSGHGFKLGPAVGVMIADMVTRASTPTAALDRTLFRYARFAEGQPVVGKYEYSIAG